MERYLAVTHTTVSVTGDLRVAEEFYRWLFDLDVAWREPTPAGQAWDRPWSDIEASGPVPEITFLHSGAFRLAVVVGEPRERGVIDHVGFQVSQAQLAVVRGRALERGFFVINDRPGEIFDFVDVHGVEWELDTRSFADPVAIVEAKRMHEAAGS